jgi:hypothetical protein
MELIMLAIMQPIRPPSLWNSWWDAIGPLRPAFSRVGTFLWFATAVAGLTVRTELAGVTSIIRALNLQPRLYDKLCDHFHSTAVDLDRLAALWTQALLRLFPGPVRVNGRLVLVGDGIKIGKRGKKMPGVGVRVATEQPFGFSAPQSLEFKALEGLNSVRPEGLAKTN